MEYSKIVIPVLRSQRELLLQYYGKADIIGQKDNSATNIVTATDIEVENNTSSELKKLFPDIPFVGEEGGGDRKANKFWLMDPIDGTQHYVRGLPFCTSMLALIEDGKVQFSAIYDFVNDHMYSAERGKGAYCNDEKISVSNRNLSQSYIGWESNQSKEENRKITYEIRKKVSIVNTINAGWELAMVASGKLDGRICYEPYGKDYDFAPGALLVQEAGGSLANIGSRSYDYRNTSFIASNPIIFKELTEGENALFPIIS